jgi:uncharacterized protein (DUF111 family)
VVSVKVSQTPSGKVKISPEYEDCRKLALENEVPLQVIYQAAIVGYDPQKDS